MNDAELIIAVGRYLGAGFALGLGGIGSAIGMGMAAGHADAAIMRQPTTQGVMLRTMLIGQAVGGSPSVLALVVGLMIMFVPEASSTQPWISFAGFVSAGLAIGLGCFGSGWGCGWPAGEGCEGTARNPRHAPRIAQGMILGQAVAQSPSLFALVISLILLFVSQGGATAWTATGAALGASLAIGAGAIGSGLGSGYTAGGAIQGISRWPGSYGQTVRTMLIGQAVGQTPAIFGLLAAFIILFAMRGLEDSVIGFARTLAAGLAVGFGGIGPGYGCGLAGGSGCEAIATHPRREALVLRTMLIGQAVSQSTAIYALIIGLVILYVT